MNSKYYLKSLFAIILIATAHISCENDEVKKPEILSFELGYENSKTAYLRSDLHIDADIIAENGIDRIVIEIHHEGDHNKSFVVAHSDHEWEFDHTYTEFKGLKNTKFHKHIDIPLDAEPGEYHFHFQHKIILLQSYSAAG